MNTIDIGEAAQNLAWLRELITRELRGVPAGSPLHRAVFSAERISGWRPGEVIASDDWYQAVGDVLSMNFLAKALHRGNAPLLDVVRTKLTAFGGNDISLGRDGQPNPARNFAWEVFVSAICAGIGNVDGAEPDVGVAYNGHRWGLACKVVSSKKPSRLEDLAVEGAKQLEGSRCHLGVVMVNVTHLIPREPAFPRSNEEWHALAAKDRTAHDAAIELDAHVSALGRSLFARPSTTRRLLRDAATGQKRTRCRLVCLVAQAVTPVGSDLVLLTAGKWLEFRSTERGESAFKLRFQDSHLALADYRLVRAPVAP